MQCSICGSENVEEVLIDRALPHISIGTVLLKNLKRTTCNDCGASTTAVPNYNAVIKQAAENLCKLKRKLRGEEFSFLRKRIGKNGQECAEQMGVTNVTVSRWENETVELPPTADRLVRTWVLASMGYSYRSIDKLFRAIQEVGIEKVEIDLNKFNGNIYQHSTCHVFGSKKTSRPVTVVKNLAFDIHG